MIRIDWLLYSSFFFLGINKVSIYLPLFIVYFLLKLLSDEKSNLYNKKCLVNACVMLIYLIFLFIFGVDYLTLDFPYNTLLLNVVFMFFTAEVMCGAEDEKKKTMLLSYLLGIAVDSLSIVLYSYMTDSSLYGYGRLVSPFSNIELNSPGVSNILSLCFVFFLYFAINSPFYLYKLFCSLGVLIFLAAAFFLGGRAFFIIAIFSFAYYLIGDLSFKSIFKYIVVSLFIVLPMFLLLSSNEHVIDYFDFVFSRFSSSGLESNRYSHYLHGIEMLPLYPFGGFSVNTDIEYTKWFHNIFLDTARVSGWLPLALILFYFTYIFVVLFNEDNFKEKNRTVYKCLFLSAFLLMLQDVIIEGNIRVLFVSYMASQVLLSRNRCFD